MRMHAQWSDRERQLSLSLANGSRMLEPRPRKMDVRIVPASASRRVMFDGKAKVVRS